MKFIIVLFILLIIFLYYIYYYIKNNIINDKISYNNILKHILNKKSKKSKKSEESEDSEELNTNSFYNDELIKFNENIRENCNNDDCYLSYYLVNLVIDMINKNGLQKTISYMRTHRNEFLTQKGEYVFIFSKYEENYNFLYHHHNELDDKNMINAQTGLNNSGVCDETICNINDVIHKLAVFADKYNEGFEEYRWFSPISNEIINKRSYIKNI